MNRYEYKPTCPPIAPAVEVPAIFYRELMPAVKGDDTGPEAPYVGKRRNTLLVYEANNAIYLFSSDGNFTFLGYGYAQMTKQEIEKLVSESVGAEAVLRELADQDLQNQIDAIVASSDVKDIVGTYADLEDYDTSKLGDNDIIKVLQDETHDDETTYYRWSTSTQEFTLIGEVGPYYTKAEADQTFQGKLTAGTNITIASDNTISASAGKKTFYVNATETGATRHIYSDNTFATAVSAQDIIDAIENGEVNLCMTTTNDPTNFSLFTLENYYNAPNDIQFIFTEGRTFYDYDCTTATDTIFDYFYGESQQKLTAGTNITISGSTISASIPIDTTYDSASGNPVANSTITNSLDRAVVTDVDINATPSTTTVSLDEVKTNLATPSSTTTTTVALPVASTTQAGIMNKATYDSLTQAIQDIANIKSEVVAITGLPASPTQQELTTAWMAASGETALINGAGIYDTTNEKRWTYYSNDTTWHWLDANASIHVQQWTNSAAGIVKGSTVDGQIYAESDGTGSVNGWDTLNTAVGNNTSKLSTIQQGAEVNVQSNWNEADNTSDAYIQNKPSIPTNTSDLNNDSNFITGTNVGSQIIPVYINNGVATAAKVNASGANWNIIPQVKGDGVMEVGKYIDFHVTDAGTEDSTARLEVTTTGQLKNDSGDFITKDLNTVDTNASNITTINTELNDASFIDSTIGTLSNSAYVSTANIQDVAVTTAKIANLNVTDAKLASNSVTTTKIADDAVTADKIDWTTLLRISDDGFKKSFIFADGTLIATRNITETVNITTTWGSLYKANTTDNWTLASVNDVDFIAEPTVTISPRSTGTTSYWIGMNENCSPVLPTGGRWRMPNAAWMYLRPDSRSSATVGVSLFAFGRWK